MFATEPITVRFPANVLLMASAYHIVFGSINLSIHDADNKTNGTFETRLDAMTEKMLK